MDGACAMHGGMLNCIRIDWKLQWKRPLETHSREYKIILNWIFGKEAVKMWVELNWLRLGSNCGVLRKWWWAFG